MKIGLIGIVFIGLTALCSLAEPFGTNLSLRAALDYGTRNNPQLAAADNQWMAAKENIRIQKALPDPTLSYGYYFESVETRVGPQIQRISVAQKLPAFGKRGLRAAVASEAAAVAFQHRESIRLKLDKQIAGSWAELYYLGRSISLTRQNIDLLKNLEGVALAKYKAGAAMSPVLQVQVELSQLEDRLKSLEDLHHPLSSRLNAVLNRPNIKLLSFPEKIPYSPLTIKAETLLSKMENTSPELAGLTSQLNKETNRARLAKRNWIPDLTLSLQYIDTDDADMTTDDNGKDAIIGGVSINVPLWFGKNKATELEATYQKQAARLLLENRNQTLEADLHEILFKLRDAERKINLYTESLIPKAEQSFEVAQQGYEAGKIDFINLIDTERQLLEFTLAHERALTDHIQHRATLSKLSGVDFLKGEINE
jgi:cobalt-zinc-cadmium efflux system outer membrane protein